MYVCEIVACALISFYNFADESAGYKTGFKLTTLIRYLEPEFVSVS